MKSSHRTHPEAKGHAHKLQLKTDMDMHESKNCREFLDAQKFKSSDTGNKALSSFDDRLQAFAYCETLQEVELPPALRYIAHRAFTN